MLLNSNLLRFSLYSALARACLTAFFHIPAALLSLSAPLSTHNRQRSRPAAELGVCATTVQLYLFAAEEPNPAFLQAFSHRRTSLGYLIYVAEEPKSALPAGSKEIIVV